MSRAVGLECPDFHLSETLSAELCLTTERLLSYQRVRPDRACMYLVIHKMGQLEHIYVTDCHLLLELVTRQTVIKTCLARQADRWRQTEFVVLIIRLADIGLDLGFARTVKNGCCEMQSKHACGPAQMRFKDLSDVHTRRHTERIQHDLDRRSIRQIRHVLFRQNTCDNALVTMTSGHFVADRKLTLHCDKDLDHLDNARRQLVTLLQLRYFLVINIRENIDLAFGSLLVLFDLARNVDRTC